MAQRPGVSWLELVRHRTETTNFAMKLKGFAFTSIAKHLPRPVAVMSRDRSLARAPDVAENNVDRRLSGVMTD